MWPVLGCNKSIQYGSNGKKSPRTHSDKDKKKQHLKWMLNLAKNTTIPRAESLINWPSITDRVADLKFGIGVCVCVWHN